MGARKARLAYAIREGKPVPPPTAPEMFEEETVLLPKRVATQVTELLAKSKYAKNLTRSKYIALLVEAACNHEEMLADREAAQHNLVAPATPQQMAQIAGQYVGRRTGG